MLFYQKAFRMNQALYNDVWQQLLDAERCYRYYNDLADRYWKRHKIRRWIMAVCSVVGGNFDLHERLGWVSCIYYMCQYSC